MLQACQRSSSPNAWFPSANSRLAPFYVHKDHMHADRGVRHDFLAPESESESATLCGRETSDWSAGEDGSAPGTALIAIAGSSRSRSSTVVPSAVARRAVR